MGIVLIKNNIKAIKVGESTKEHVLHELGSPTSESNFGPKTFYYINVKTEKIAFFDEKSIEQRVLAIRMNDNDMVTDITEYTLDDSNQVAFSEKKTEIKGNTLTPIEQILTNIGKFNRKQKQF